MTGPELRATLHRLGLSQVEAARLLGTTGNTVSKWACGYQPVPQWVERDLWLAETVLGVAEALRVRVRAP